MIAIVLVTIVIVALGAMTIAEAVAFKDYPWVSHVNFIPVAILLIALTAFICLLV